MRWNEKQTIEKFNKTKRLFFENINKIDKPIVRLINEERMRIQITNVSNERRCVVTCPTDIKG